MTAREILARRGRKPIVIERTVKNPGDRVLHSWALPAVTVEKRENSCGV